MGSPFSQVDLRLLKKYDRPGPRYTSYPTAPLFSNSFTNRDFRREIVDTNGPGSSGISPFIFIFLSATRSAISAAAQWSFPATGSESKSTTIF